MAAVLAHPDGLLQACRIDRTFDHPVDHSTGLVIEGIGHHGDLGTGPKPVSASKAIIPESDVVTQLGENLRAVAPAQTQDPRPEAVRELEVEIAGGDVHCVQKIEPLQCEIVIRLETLVERQGQLGALEGAIAITSEQGTSVLISGEAGHGKSSIINEALEQLDHRYTVLTAACEPVGIPAAFSPLFEFLGHLPTELQSDIRSGAGRPVVLAAMLDLLKNDRVILVLEDIHWADEATLALVRYLGKRIDSTNSCLIVSYRTEELDVNAPLRLVVADLGPTSVRIDLPPLSLGGVGQMTQGSDLDPAAVYKATLGNPFFVSEVLRHPAIELPPTIQNAVLATASQIPSGGHELLYTVALSSDGVEISIAESLMPDAPDSLDLALQKRLLTLDGNRVVCRHDLIRESLAQAVPEASRRRIHRNLLSHLEASGDESPDIARLAYHSFGAADGAKAAGYSLLAARSAAAEGAHRQAAYHYDRVLLHRDQLESVELLAVLLDAAQEHCVVNSFERACELSRTRMELIEDGLDRARAQAWYGFFESRRNDLASTRKESTEALDLLRSAQPSEELSLALGTLAWAELVEGNLLAALELGDEAAAVGIAVGSPRMEIYGATTASTARAFNGDPEGVPQLEEAARRSVESRLGEFVGGARALNNRGNVALRSGKLDEALHWFDRLIDYATAHELDAWYVAGMATRSVINLNSGRWPEADRDLEVVIGQRTCISTEVEVLVASATLRARRADPGSQELIESALSYADQTPDYQLGLMAGILALEGAWMGLLPVAEAESRYNRLSQLPQLAADPAGCASLAYWANRVGFAPPTAVISGPTGLELRGDVREAARRWEQMGFVIEAALTGSMAKDADLEQIFSTLDRLGAVGVTKGLRRELARRGVRNVPRGERPTTKRHPAGLTNREAEVLALVVAGMSNLEIADRLYITEKTASHHVSAILAKLGVPNRMQAVALATSKGWVSAAPR